MGKYRYGLVEPEITMILISFLGATGHHRVKHTVDEEQFLSYTTANR